ncbi:MAG: uridine kinase [Lachnospiraceae bacterium]|nr:uridine kinase [Lachnospiraceae bacterium]
MKCTIIGVAGGTGSGKSTFTNRLKQRFGDHISVIYHDSYYRCHDNIPFEERVTLNYDHPDSLETDLLIQHVEMLKNGIAVQAPVYDFTVHNRKKETVEIKPSPIIVIEGILALQDPRLRDLMDIKIFVEADADERILRRVVRDVEERGRDIRGIISQYLNTVKPMHYIYVEPTKYMADIVINSGLNDVAFDILSAKIDQLLEQNETGSAS